MARKIKPSKVSLGRIFGRLHVAPFYLDNWRSTGLHSRSVVHKTIKYLNDKGLISRKRVGHRLYYSLEKCDPPYIGFEIPWIDLMMTEQDRCKKNIKIDMKLKIPRLLYYQRELKIMAMNKFREYVNDPINYDAINYITSSGYDLKREQFGKTNEIVNLYNEELLCSVCFPGHKSRNGYIIDLNGECVCTRCGTVLDQRLNRSMNQ